MLCSHPCLTNAPEVSQGAQAGKEAIEGHRKYSKESILIDGKQFQIFYMKLTGYITKHNEKVEWIVKDKPQRNFTLRVKILSSFF